MADQLVQLHSDPFVTLEALCSAHNKDGADGARQFLKSYFNSMSARLASPILDGKNDDAINFNMEEIGKTVITVGHKVAKNVPEDILNDAITKINNALTSDSTKPTPEERKKVVDAVSEFSKLRFNYEEPTSSINVVIEATLGKDRYKALCGNSKSVVPSERLQEYIVGGYIVAGCYVNEVTEKPKTVALHPDILKAVDAAMAEAQSNPQFNPAIASQTNPETQKTLVEVGK